MKNPSPLWLLSLMIILPVHEAWGGACTATRFHDWQNHGCNQNDGGAGGPPKAKCPDCPPKGMPRWWVSEPYISLSMLDEPLSYTLSSGQEMAFQFYYCQRTQLPKVDEVSALPKALNYEIYPGITNGSTCGTNAWWGNNWTKSITVWDPQWENSWLSSASKKSPPNYSVYSRGYSAFVWRPEGGIDYYNIQAGSRNNINLQSQVRMTGVVADQNYPIVWNQTGASEPTKQNNNPPAADANGIYWGDAGIGVKLLFPDGSQEVYSLTAYPAVAVAYSGTASPSGNSTTRLMLTQRIDPQGRVTSIGYEKQSSPPIPFFRVRYVVDPDGRTNKFLYSSSFQLSEIDDPYGRKTTLTYSSSTASGGLLGSIVDAAGMTNSFKYLSGCGWITNLNTPYGNTSFAYYSSLDAGATTPDSYVQRAIYVTEPTGAQQLYYYLHNNPTMTTSLPAPTVPGQTNFDNGINGGISGHNSLAYRNTFHWGRRQFAALAGNFTLTSGLFDALRYQGSNPSYSASQFSSALSALGASDYRKAYIKHWLLSGADGFSMTEGLSSEQDPSPDAAGTIPGLRTWYNYPGKPINGAEELGNNPQVSCVARLLPDGISQYTIYNYYAVTGFPGSPAGAGLASSNEKSYSKPDGTIGVLTNWYQYSANSIDLVSISNSIGQYVNYAYNSSHQIVYITNALNQVTSLSWNPNLAGVQLPSGKTINLNYYPGSATPVATSSMLQQMVVQPEGRILTITDYQAGLPASITDDRGLMVNNTWDGLNRLTSTRFPDSTTISNIYTRLDLTGTKDRLGNWSYNSYDGLQHLVTATNANKFITYYSWCGCGSLKNVVDANNNLTVFNYDNQGNLTNVLYPDISTVTYQYDLAGRMINAYDGANRSLQIAYNNQNLATTINGANGLLQRTIYDAVNRPIISTDANNISVTNQYDLLNELLKQTWPDNISEGYNYTAAGLVAYTNRNQFVTLYGRDAAGRLTSVTNANLEVTRFGYDSLNSVTSLLDGMQHQTIWQYNEYGWLTNKVDHDGNRVFTYRYDANGRTTNRWTPEKGNTGYAYDPIGNLTNITYPNSQITYAYDALNRLTNMLDGVGTTTFGYTPIGQLAAETNPWPNMVASYTYNQQLRTAFNLPGSWPQTYKYDGMWRLTNVTSPAGAFNYGYNFQPASSLITSVSLPNGGGLTNVYDPLARLLSTKMLNSSKAILDSEVYVYDPAGYRTQATFTSGNYINYVYDKIGQLVGAKGLEPGGVINRMQEQLGYAYDKAGNLARRTNAWLVEPFKVDNVNQLTNVSWTGSTVRNGSPDAAPLVLAGATFNTQTTMSAQWSDGLTGPSHVPVVNSRVSIYWDKTFAAIDGLPLSAVSNIYTVSVGLLGYRGIFISITNVPVKLPPGKISYDLNGNMTNDGYRTFGYDAENQLTNIQVTGQWRSIFVYDGLGRRRIERDYSWNASASVWAVTNEIRSIYDRNLLVQERDGRNRLLVTYTRGLDLGGGLQRAGGIGGLLARTDPLGSTFYHADGNGNIMTLMNGAQNVVARYVYNPFGQLEGAWGAYADVNKMQFSSVPIHQLSGLSLYLYRAYSPNLQRWMNQDPVQELGGLNLYRFVRNSPENWIDPLGLCINKGKLARCLLDIGINEGLGSIPGLGLIIPDFNIAQALGGDEEFDADYGLIGDVDKVNEVASKNADAQFELAGGESKLQRLEGLSGRKHGGSLNSSRVKQLSKLKALNRAAKAFGIFGKLLRAADIINDVNECIKKSQCDCDKKKKE